MQCSTLSPLQVRCVCSWFLLLVVGCDSSVVSRPDTPADEVLLVVDNSIPLAQVQSLTQALGAPVRYLGRLETPLRVTQVASLQPDLLRSAALLVLVDARQSMLQADAELASLPEALRVESHASGEPDEGSSWSTYENAFLAQQTIVTAEISVHVTSEQAASLGRAIRASLERSQVRHQRVQLRRSVGAALLPPETTRGLFRLLVPGGYAWSDTSSAWPQSVQIATTRPTRVVTVFWLEGASHAWLQSREFLVGMLRDAMWRLQRDRLEEDSIEWLASSDESPAMSAIWQNPDLIAGGPMQARFVYDPARQRLYGIQALVFLPGADKHRALQEAIALASTFEIVEPF